MQLTPFNTIKFNIKLLAKSPIHPRQVPHFVIHKLFYIHSLGVIQPDRL